MAAIIQLRRATAAEWTAANSVLAEGELGAEKDTLKVKMGDGITAWNLLSYAFSFITIGDADELNRGLSEEATVTELINGTATGGTGAKLFITPAKLISYRSFLPISAIVSGGVLNLNFGTLVETLFNVATTITANCTVTVTETNAKSFALQFAVTGTITITMPSSFVFETGEVTLGRWNSSTKVLTLTGTTNTEFEIVGLKRGSVWRCISSKYIRCFTVGNDLIK